MRIKCEDAPKEEKPSVPCLMESSCGAVIFATKTPTEVTLAGVCVKVGKGTGHVGDYSSRWDRSDFTPYRGRVTMENGE